MTAALLKRPPQRLFYFTADIGRMAVVRRDGGIFFQTPVGDQSGILLWSHLDPASEYQIAREGRPAVVVEFDRSHIDTSLLERVEDPTVRPRDPYRAWIYPNPIWFESVRWHTFREDLAEPARTYVFTMPDMHPQDPLSLPQGTISIPIQ
jgi:hypothetical protein